VSKKKSVLEGYKKVKSKFIPPMMQFHGEINEVSYVNQVLPEIIWMGLVSDKFGYKKCVDICTDIAQQAFELKESEEHINFAIASNFLKLSKKSRSILVDRLENKDLLKALQECLLPLLFLYDDCPLNFLEDKEMKIDKTTAVKLIKDSIFRHMDKYATPALVIQANVTYIRGVTGGLFYMEGEDGRKGVKPPDLNSLLRAPGSEEAQRVGSHVRMGALMEFSYRKEEQSQSIWAETFWNQSYKLDPCKFMGDEDEPYR